MTTPTAVPEPFSAEGAALIEPVTRWTRWTCSARPSPAGEPSGPDLLVRAYLESGNWHAAVEWLTPLVAAGHVRFAGALGHGAGRDRGPGPGRGDAAAGRRLRRPGARPTTWRSCSATRTGPARRCTCWRGRPTPASRTPDPTWSSCTWRPATCRQRSRSPNATPTRAARRRRSPWPRCAAGRATPTRPSACTAGPCELGALRAHTAYGQFLQHVREDWAGAEREFREAERLRRARLGLHPRAGSCSTTGDPTRPGAYLELAATTGTARRPRR